MALLITVLIYYLVPIFWRFLSTTIKIVDRGDVNQVGIGGRDTGNCTTQLSITTIFPSFLRISAGGVSVCFCQGIKLIVSRLDLFFFIRFRIFIFFIGPLAYLIISIYFLNACRRLKCKFRLIFEGLIKKFVLNV